MFLWNDKGIVIWQTTVMCIYELEGYLRVWCFFLIILRGEDNRIYSKVIYGRNEHSFGIKIFSLYFATSLSNSNFLSIFKINSKSYWKQSKLGTNISSNTGCQTREKITNPIWSITSFSTTPFHPNVILFVYKSWPKSKLDT